eukprot:6889073-Prymnesium_polylepis.1
MLEPSTQRRQRPGAVGERRYARAARLRVRLRARCGTLRKRGGRRRMRCDVCQGSAAAVRLTAEN